MAAFYTDQPVARATTELVRAAGHSVTRTQQIGRGRAADDEQLLYTAQQDWILISHDNDFIWLHQIWLRD